MVYYQTENSTKPYNYNIIKYTDYFFPSHLHRDFELAYVNEGSCHITIDGREEMISAGEFALVLQNSIHSYHTKEKSEITVCVFGKEYTPEFCKIAENKKYAKNCFFMTEEEEKVFFSHTTQKSPSTLDIAVAMNIACSAFLRQNKNSLKGASKLSTDDLMHKILEIISEHYTENITLKELSYKLGYEEHYISRCFNKYFNKNFKSFINELRLSYAIESISKNPDVTITEIALTSGFQSVRSFNRVYKNIMGHSPSHYKK